MQVAVEDDKDNVLTIYFSLCGDFQEMFDCHNDWQRDPFYAIVIAFKGRVVDDNWFLSSYDHNCWATY